MSLGPLNRGRPPRLRFEETEREGFAGEVLPPAEAEGQPIQCDECCRDLGGRLARVTEDNRVVCSGCDPSVPEE